MQPVSRRSTPCGRLAVSILGPRYQGCSLPGAIESLGQFANERLLAGDDDAESIRRIERVWDVDALIDAAGLTAGAQGSNAG